MSSKSDLQSVKRANKHIVPILRRQKVKSAWSLTRMCAAVVSAFVMSACGRHQVKTAECRRLDDPADCPTWLPKADGWTDEELGVSPGDVRAGGGVEEFNHPPRKTQTSDTSVFLGVLLSPVCWRSLICRE